MELRPINPTVRTPARNFTGDVHLPPVHSGREPSRMTTWLAPVADERYQKANGR